MRNQDRPLSPHLSVYRPQMTSVLSILHRATGMALVVGLFGVVWFLLALAHSESAYNIFISAASHPLGLLVVLGLTFSLYYHLCNGIRHLIWDTGHLFEIRNATLAGIIVVFAAVTLSVLTWCYTLYLIGLAA